jgi:four helix bundle protein
MQNAKWKMQNGGTAMKGDGLRARLISYAVKVGQLVEEVPETRMGRHIAGQLLRCGTSPAPNYAEACAAESPDDFVHKLRIALKELREAETWLEMIVSAGLMPKDRLHSVVDECQQLARILAASIITTRKNQQRSP